MNTISEPLMLPAPRGVGQPLPVEASPQPLQIWRQLGYLNLYRFVLASTCLMLGINGSDYLEIDQGESTLFIGTTLVYLLLTLVSHPLIRWQIVRPEWLAYAQISTDIIAITLLMHASGGVHSGLGMLLVVAIAVGSLILAGQPARFFAALAALAVLIEQILAGLIRQTDAASYTHAGLLGAGLFATAILAHSLARRLRETEALATRRGIDLAHMAQLTEYIIQRMQTGIVVVDADQRVILVNESARQLLDCGNVDQSTNLAELSPELATELHQWQFIGVDEAHALRLGPQGGEFQPRFARLDQAGRSGTLVFLEDLTAATQRAQQIKLASLGQLTASIAHEIRNPLAAICHAGQLLSESPGLASGDRRLLEIILSHGERVNTIVRNIMQLSRRERSQPYRLNLALWLETFADRFRHDHDLDETQLSVDIEPLTIIVQIDPDQFQMILDNLCENALRHGRSQGLRLRLEARHKASQQRPYLDIVDNGPGIDAEAREHLFEPFFTTSRDGTGLGLYIAHELCASNQAQIALVPQTRDEPGCRFRITFSDPRRRQIP